MANSMPMTAIHIGTNGGSVSEKRAAVTKAASLTFAFSRLMERITRYSAAAPIRATSRPITTWRQPKK